MTRVQCETASAAAAKVTLNKDAGWQEFESEAYFQHYYGDPHPDDYALTVLAARALRNARAAADRGFEVVDVGTGPSLIPLLAALPVAARLTAWEFAKPNLDWLADEISSPALRPQWQHFWSAVQAAYADPVPETTLDLPHDPLPLLAERTQFHQGSIFDLPRHRFDAATMFFCAESITASLAEFQAGLAAFTGTVRPGGVIAAAFLAGSSGYQFSNRHFPAVAIGPSDISAALAASVPDLEIVPIGLSDREVRSGYSGALFISGRIAA